MPKRVMYLPGEPAKQLVISWRGIWRNLAIYYDGALVGTIPDKVAAEQGREFLLSDGSRLHVQVIRHFIFSHLEVLHNGQEVPTPPADPQTITRVSLRLVYLVAAIQVLAGMVGALGSIADSYEITTGRIRIMIGIAMFGLTFFIRRGSWVALLGALLLPTVSTITESVLKVSVGDSLRVSSIFNNILFIVLWIPIVKLFRTAQAQKRRKADA